MPFNKETEYFMRVVNLVFQKGTEACRRTLLYHSLLKYDVASFQDVLQCSAVVAKLRKLKGVINKDQMAILNPSSGGPVTVDMLDIALCFVLLKNICGLREPATKWYNPPAPTDNSLEGALAEIKAMRNVLCHSEKALLTKADFEKHFKEIKRALLNVKDTVPFFKILEKELDQYVTTAISEKQTRELNDIKSRWLTQDIMVERELSELEKITCDKMDSMRLTRVMLEGIELAHDGCSSYDGSSSSSSTSSLSTENLNFMRLIIFIHQQGVPICRAILAELTTKKYQTSPFYKVLSTKSVKQKLEKLKGKHTTLEQWIKLYPPDNSNVAVEDLDIWLCFILLKNVCGLKEPQTKWENLPNKDDTTLEGALAVFFCITEETVVRMNSPNLTNADFENLFSLLTDAFKDLAGYITTVTITIDAEEYKTRKVEPEVYLDCLQQMSSQSPGILKRLLSFRLTAEEKYGSERLRRITRKAWTFFREEKYKAAKQGSIDDTPFHKAADEGDVDRIRQILKTGASVNCVNDEGDTPLQLAALRGHMSVIKALVAEKVNIQLANYDGWTALMDASIVGNTEVVEYLLTCGTDVLLQDKHGFTALHLASQEGHVEVTEVLLKAGANVDHVNEEGVTALYLASKNGHMSVVKTLVAYKADVNMVRKDGWTPLMEASFEGYTEVTNYLLTSGTDVLLANNNGSTALHHASQNGHLEVIESLLKGGADVNQVNKRGAAPLHRASLTGHLSVVKTLVCYNADTNLAANDGTTALMAACFDGNIEVVNFLLKSGADILLEENNCFTALHFAAREGHFEVTEVLLKAGANANQASNVGVTPLHRASQNGHLSVIKTLVAHEADVDLASKDGITALMIASLYGNTEVVNYLLTCETDVLLADKNGVTALHCAVQNGHMGVTDILLKAGANVNQINNNCVTPLHLASEKGHVSVVQILTANRANVHLIDNNGKTPVQIASSSGHTGIVALLNSVIYQGTTDIFKGVLRHNFKSFHVDKSNADN